MSRVSTDNLRKFGLFQTLTDEDAALLANFTKEKKFPSNTALLRTGQICSNIYLLISCTVEKTSMDNQKQMLQGGAFIGIREILEGRPMDADFMIAEEGTALVIPGTALEELLLLSPTLATSLLNEM